MSVAVNHKLPLPAFTDAIPGFNINSLVVYSVHMYGKRTSPSVIRSETRVKTYFYACKNFFLHALVKLRTRVNDTTNQIAFADLNLPRESPEILHPILHAWHPPPPPPPQSSMPGTPPPPQSSMPGTPPPSQSSMPGTPPPPPPILHAWHPPPLILHAWHPPPQSSMPGTPPPPPPNPPCLAPPPPPNPPCLAPPPP